MKKLLYVSVHPVLEYDETSLFSEMGVSVSSLTACEDSENQSAPLRPMSAASSAEPEPLDRFDIILSSSVDWLVENWHTIKKKKVIWRTFGRSDRFTEQRMRPFRAEGLQIVRYSPMEARIDGYLGAEAFIRPYKDPEVFQGWTGRKETIINYTRNMKYRGRECNFAFLKKVVRGFPFKLAGPQNDNIDEPWAGGLVGFDEMIADLQACRAYLYTGTYPACYTLSFVEAWMTGIPVVALGRGRGSDPQVPGPPLYEIPDLVSHGVDGFFSDDEKELGQILKDLILDHRYAAGIGEKGRQKAIEIFGKKRQKARWAEFLTR